MGSVLSQKTRLARSIICGSGRPTRRLVVVGHVPSVDAGPERRQQGALHPRRQLQVLLERALFGRRQVIQTEARDRIRHQPLWLDRLLMRRSISHEGLGPQPGTCASNPVQRPPVT